jgi:hypothetical protein
VPTHKRGVTYFRQRGNTIHCLWSGSNYTVVI